MTKFLGKLSFTSFLSLIFLCTSTKAFACDQPSVKTIEHRPSSFVGRNGDYSGNINTDASISNTEKLVNMCSHTFVVSGQLTDGDITSIYSSIPIGSRNKISSINQFRSYDDIKAQYEEEYKNSPLIELIETLIIYHGVMVFINWSVTESHIYSAEKVENVWVTKLNSEQVH